MVDVISLNVNELLSPVKRNKILTKLKRENIDIEFLQEIHMTGIEHEKLKRQGFKHVFSSSNGSNHTRGVVILISGRVMYEHISTIKAREGRFILIKGKVMEICLPSTMYIFLQAQGQISTYKYWIGLQQKHKGLLYVGVILTLL